MKVTISTRTTTIETTQPGEVLNRETVKALTGRTEAWQTVERLALAAPVQEPEAQTEIDMTPDPLEDLGIGYTDVSPEVLEAEAQYDLAHMVPANILAAE
jgi:hypothetical protein